MHKHIPYDLNLKVKHDLEVLDSFSLFLFGNLLKISGQFVKYAAI